MKTTFVSALSIVLLVFSLSFSAPQTAKPILIRGSETPELIPTFTAWETFTTVVEHCYENSILDSYLARNARLAEIPGYEPLSQSAVSLVADFASYSQRELKRIKNKQNDLRESHKRGLLTDSDLTDQFLSNIGEQVDFLTRSSETLRDKLVGLDPEVGSAVWNQLVFFCNTHIKESMSLSSDETEEDLAVRTVWKRFDPKPIPVHRKKSQNNILHSGRPITEKPDRWIFLSRHLLRPSAPLYVDQGEVPPVSNELYEIRSSCPTFATQSIAYNSNLP